MAKTHYVIEDGGSGEVLSRHHTRQGAVDTWRLRHHGRSVKVFRLGPTTGRKLIVEGVWHEPTRSA